MILEDLARANGALVTKEAIAAFVALAKGASPEDAYLEHVCGCNKASLLFTPNACKAAVRLVPNFEDFYKQFSFWMPKVDMPAIWSTFKSFYEPLMSAGLLNANMCLLKLKIRTY